MRRHHLPRAPDRSVEKIRVSRAGNNRRIETDASGSSGGQGEEKRERPKWKIVCTQGSLSGSPLSGKVQAPIFHGINRQQPDTATPLKNSFSLAVSAGKASRRTTKNSIKNRRSEFRRCVTIPDKPVEINRENFPPSRTGDTGILDDSACGGQPPH